VTAGRAELGLADAARAAIRQWARFIGDGEADGDEDAWAMGAAVAKLADALAEIGAAPSRRLGLAALADAANEVRSSGRPGVLTDSGVPAVLVIAPGTLNDPARAAT
jgi:hypothetical protein